MLVLAALLFASFPGMAHTATSPAGHYSLRWVEATSSTPHRLLLGSVVVREFDRHVDVLWSPNGESFAVTDSEGSDSSRVYVYSSRHPSRGEELRVDVSGMHHAYVTATEWRGESVLMLRVEGYGDRELGAKVECREDRERWTCGGGN